MAQSKLVAGLQCSNCGGYMVYDTVSKSRLLNLAEVHAGRRNVLFAVICLVAALLSCFVGGTGAAVISSNITKADCYNFTTTSSCPTQYVALIYLFYILFAILVLAAIVFFVRYSRRGRSVRLHEYRCRLCGYAWEWREDQPKPNTGQVTPKSDLIRKGQERLRRDTEMAAADAYQRKLRGEL